MVHPLPRALAAVLAAVLAVVLTAGCAGGGAAEATPPAPPAAPRAPNVLFVLADDLGYGEVGFAGQERIATPRLDRLAREGMVLTAHYAGSTVCAPSRASLMSGLHQGRAPIRGNRVDALPDSVVTLAEVLRARGYRTAMFGKWGLGDVGTAGEPTRQGFDAYYGYLDQVHAHNHYPGYLVRDGVREPLRNEVIERKVPYADLLGSAATRKVDYAEDLLVAEAAAFIREAAAAREPFFVYLPVVIPHVNNESYLTGHHGMEVPSLGRYADEVAWPEAERAKAAMITYLDRDVGRLVDLVDSLGLDSTTLVVFTSDNGPATEGVDPTFFDGAGPFRGHKRLLYEGGIRVPTVARWPGVVPAGATRGDVTAFWDWKPTLAEAAGAPAPTGGDGVSFLPVLRDEPAPAVAARPYLYWEFVYWEGATQAVRAGRWKYLRRLDAGTEELYDLAADPGEAADLAAERPEVVARLRAYADEAHVAHPRYPLPGEEQ